MTERDMGADARAEIRALATRVGTLSESMAVMAERERRVLDELKDLNAELLATNTKLAVLQTAADRWKGAFIVIVGAGSLVSMVLSWGKPFLELIRSR